MQRTVYSTKFTYAKTELHEDGTFSTVLDTVTAHETDEKKAYKMASKIVGNFAPLKTEKVAKLWVLEDEIFFKYAKPQDIEPTEDTKTDEK